jgi:hypothetical protein
MPPDFVDARKIFERVKREENAKRQAESAQQTQAEGVQEANDWLASFAK